MKIIFFGLGSIGTRHAKLIMENFDHTLFAFRSNKVVEPNKLGIKEVYSWDEVSKISPEVAFITNPTCLHLKTAIKCAKLGINLFIEKPVDCKTDGLDKLIAIVKGKKLSTYVAYCMRFHPVIKQVQKELNREKSMHSRIAVSSYLPDWRNNRDYRNIYSAKGKMGGGVIFDLSHEIDYSDYLFGGILDMYGTYGRLSDLKTDCEDYADIIMKCGKGIVNLHMNFFSRNWERTVNIDLGNSDYIKADLINNTVLVKRHRMERNYNYAHGKYDMYLNQLKYFFKNIKNRKMMNNISEASRLFRKIIMFKNKNKGFAV